MEIKQIAVSSSETSADCIYGLGDDGLVYWWDKELRKWQLEHNHKFEKETAESETETCHICKYKRSIEIF